jgi:hypothetical protein
MTTFNKTVNPNQYFHYQRGSVHTGTAWKRPSYQSIKDFFTVINQETDILSKYDVYLMGGVLYDFNQTWDVDLCITGHIQNHEELENDMNLMYDLALNHFRLLLDIQWYEKPLPVVTYEEITSENFVHYKLKYIKTAYIKKEVGSEVDIVDSRNNEGVIKLTEYLVEGYHNEYPGTKEKVINRIKNNPNRILKSVFDVKTFLTTDEQYFINNTNRL